MPKNIKSLRTDIQQINEEIIALIAERIQTAQQIGKIKDEQNKPIHQPDQERRVLEFCKQKAKQENISSKDIESVFSTIIAMSRRSQNSE
jgi:chorismate mutase